MNIQKITPIVSFKNQSIQKKEKKPEFIDKFLGVIQNQDDVNDCVAVPRGIFKAYLWIMSGFGLIGIASALPQRTPRLKSALLVIGNVCNIISAFFFAKPFAFRGVSPTISLKENEK